MSHAEITTAPTSNPAPVTRKQLARPSIRLATTTSAAEPDAFETRLQDQLAQLRSLEVSALPGATTAGETAILMSLFRAIDRTVRRAADHCRTDEQWVRNKIGLAAHLTAEKAWNKARDRGASLASKLLELADGSLADVLRRADVWAKAMHLLGFADRDGVPYADEDSISFGKAMEGHVRRVAASASASSPDADLIAMGQELKRRWNAEGVARTDEEVEAALDYSSAIANEIMARPAATVAGLQAKAEAITWAADGPEYLETVLGQSTFAQFIVQMLAELRDGTAEGPRIRVDRRNDPWADKVRERDRLVDYVNSTAEALPEGTDDEAYFKLEMDRQWALATDIQNAPAHDPQARAAQIRLCLKMDEEGIDMGARALELLRIVEATLPPMPGEVIQ